MSLWCFMTIGWSQSPSFFQFLFIADPDGRMAPVARNQTVRKTKGGFLQKDVPGLQVPHSVLQNQGVVIKFAFSLLYQTHHISEKFTDTSYHRSINDIQIVFDPDNLFYW
jgi:hypothetical protein